MNEATRFEAFAKALKGKAKPLPQKLTKALKTAVKRTELTPEAPAPRLNDMIAERGLEPTTEALSAWDARVRGKPIMDVAHELGISIAGARALVKEAHAAIAEDLKEALSLNRQLDLDRIDHLIGAFYPGACAGDIDAAQVTLKALAHRARLIGVEGQPENIKGMQPQNVLVWIQQQLPSINRIVDSLPPELPE